MKINNIFMILILFLIVNTIAISAYKVEENATVHQYISKEAINIGVFPFELVNKTAIDYNETLSIWHAKTTLVTT